MQNYSELCTFLKNIFLKTDIHPYLYQYFLQNTSIMKKWRAVCKIQANYVFTEAAKFTTLQMYSSLSLI